MIFGLDREWAPLYGLSWKPHRRIAFPLRQHAPDRRLASPEDRGHRRRGRLQRRHRPDLAPLGHVRALAAEPAPRDGRHAVSAVSRHDDGGRRRRRACAGRSGARALAHRHARNARSAAGRRRRMFRRVGPHRPAASGRPPSSIRCATSPSASRAPTPPVNGNAGVREVEALYLDMIAAARHSIYIENQYFTADKVGEALAARLSEPDGPEVVVVLRELSHGWLEELTMQTLRTQAHRAAARRGRARSLPRLLSVHRRAEERHLHRRAFQDDRRRRRDRAHRLGESRQPLDGSRHRVRPDDRGARARRRARGDPRPARSSCSASIWAASRRACARRSRAPARCALRSTSCNATSARSSRSRICRRFRRAVLSMVSVADPEKPVALSDLADLLSSDDETAADRPALAGVGQDRGVRRRVPGADGAVEVHAARHIPRRQSHHRLGARAPATSGGCRS